MKDGGEHGGRAEPLPYLCSLSHLHAFFLRRSSVSLLTSRLNTEATNRAMILPLFTFNTSLSSFCPPILLHFCMLALLQQATRTHRTFTSQHNTRCCSRKVKRKRDGEREKNIYLIEYTVVSVATPQHVEPTVLCNDGLAGREGS